MLFRSGLRADEELRRRAGVCEAAADRRGPPRFAGRSFTAGSEARRDARGMAGGAGLIGDPGAWGLAPTCQEHLGAAGKRLASRAGKVAS